MNIEKNNFEIEKNKAEMMYKNIGEVFCPYFKENIVFNSKGLEHLKFKKKNHARSRSDQYMRFKILKYASELIRQTRTIQGISEQKIFELNRSNQKNEYILVDAIFYEFIAVLDKIRIRVIIKQINNKPKFFWSVIPFWKNNFKGVRKLHYGKPEED